MTYHQMGKLALAPFICIGHPQNLQHANQSLDSCCSSFRCLTCRTIYFQLSAKLSKAILVLSPGVNDQNQDISTHQSMSKPFFLFSFNSSDRSWPSYISACMCIWNLTFRNLTINVLTITKQKWSKTCMSLMEWRTKSGSFIDKRQKYGNVFFGNF